MSDKTILFVDDEEDIRLVVSACLEDAGYKVLTAGNVADGLQLATSQFPDLVISDVMMPDGSGYTLCTKMKEETSTKDIPVIFLTVMDDETTAMSVGATAFLSKPFEEEELLKTVSDVLQPANARAKLDEALAFLRDKRMDEGVAALGEVLEIDPDGPLVTWARYYRAQVHHSAGRGKDAQDEFLAVLAKDPTFWRAHVRLGLLFEAGDPPRAIKHYERALSLNPNQSDTRQRLEQLQSRY